tara:strand:- start:3847 stop:4656 length:810 start_codon:yes stop_codon:yes gene_type:complete
MKKLQGNIDTKSKIIGIIPVRMKASRFPGKPLKKIINFTMLEHVYLRAKFFKLWKLLIVATCDKEIFDFCKIKKIPCIMTSNKHTRCLDRVHEAAKKINLNLSNKDIVVCVQGDEPMLTADMIYKTIRPIFLKKEALSSVLAMDIVHKEQFYNNNIVKIIHDLNDEVLYTSRAPVPYCKKFSKKIKAKRVGGIFAFRWSFLKKFYKTDESFLEKVEACDSNRICDNGRGQFIARYPFRPYFSVDCPKDLRVVIKYMKKDKIYKSYQKIK